MAYIYAGTAALRLCLVCGRSITARVIRLQHVRVNSVAFHYGAVRGLGRFLIAHNAGKRSLLLQRRKAVLRRAIQPPLVELTQAPG